MTFWFGVKIDIFFNAEAYGINLPRDHDRSSFYLIILSMISWDCSAVYNFNTGRYKTDQKAATSPYSRQKLLRSWTKIALI